MRVYLEVLPDHYVTEPSVTIHYQKKDTDDINKIIHLLEEVDIRRNEGGRLTYDFQE